jgi:hypothetical protein
MSAGRSHDDGPGLWIEGVARWRRDNIEIARDLEAETRRPIHVSLFGTWAMTDVPNGNANDGMWPEYPRTSLKAQPEHVVGGELTMTAITISRAPEGSRKPTRKAIE